MKESDDRCQPWSRGGVNIAGYQSVSIPGTVAGLALAQAARHHKLSRRRSRPLSDSRVVSQ